MKKLICALACVCLLTCALCACAAFAEDFELWVGGTQVTESVYSGDGWSFDWDT